MYETWLRYAHPGLPRRLVWVFSWLLLPLLFLVVVPLHLLVHGLKDARNVVETARRDMAWLWRQRTTLEAAPWKQVR